VRQECDFINATQIRTKGNRGNVINPMDRQSRIPLYHRPPLAFPALCPPLFTTLKHGCVNYGEARFHKFRDEIWSDKFNSQDPAPWSRWAQVTRVDAHKYVCSCTRALYVQPSACRLRPSFRLSYVYRLPAAINALPARVILIRMRIVLLKKDQGWFSRLIWKYK